MEVGAAQSLSAIGRSVVTVRSLEPTHNNEGRQLTEIYHSGEQGDVTLSIFHDSIEYDSKVYVL